MPRHVPYRPENLPPLPCPWPVASIVIVTFNTGGKFIENCLRSLRALDYPDYEVIVVENGSRDSTPEVLRSCSKDEILIMNDKNRGFSGGCNDGFARARGEVLVLLNFDTVVRPDWLREIVQPMMTDNRVALTGSKMYFPDSKIIQHAGGIIHANAMTQHIGYREEDTGQFDEEKEMDYLTGAGMAIRRSFLDLCGGQMDEDYYPAYCEEMDLCYRASRMGYRVLYAPKSVLEHFESPTLENQSPMFLRLVTRGRILFCLKNYTLRQWLREWLPFEWHWMRAPYSKGRRRLQMRGYLDGLRYLLGKRYDKDNPFPGI